MNDAIWASVRRVGLFCVLLLGCLGSVVQARESITQFHSDIKVQADRSLAVKETIVVNVENRQILHGIYRDLPTTYPHPKWANFGIRDKTYYTIESIRVDGKSVPWHQISLPNGLRFYIGDKQNYISRGQHTYEIRYTTTGQLSHVEDIDSLRWNVNGQDWEFPTDQISATVYLPDNVRAKSQQAWLGKSGSIEQSYRLQENSDGSTTFLANRSLDPYEGMTVSLELPEGLVSDPSSRWQRLLKDNIKWLAGLGLLLFLPLYYFKAWLAVGRDPAKGVVVADYHPVRGLSPAAHHYITHGKSDNDTFAAALLNLAVKGYVHLKQKAKRDFTVQLLKNDEGRAEELSEGEAIVIVELFKHSDIVELGGKYQPVVAKAKSKLSRFLRQEWREAVYRDNSRYSIIGLGIGIAALVLCGLHLSNALLKVGHLVPLLIFLFVGMGFAQRIAKPLMLIPVAFLAFAGLQNTAFSLFNSSIMIWLSLFVAFLYVLFNYLLKAPTPFGNKLLDEIEGFRLYLTTAEQNRLNILHPPEKTPQLFEKLLPYAIALDVENQWNEQFAEIFQQQNEQGKQYQPRWYSDGGYGGFSGANVGSALGTGLAGSVAAASAAPSSSGSSGFGGGGAGSGGGGGGGGGW